MGRFVGGPPRPAHAQPGPLASLGRRSLVQWAAAGFAGVAVVATTLGAPGSPGGTDSAAAPAPAPAKEHSVARAALGWTLSTNASTSERRTHSPSHTHRASASHSSAAENASLAAASALAADGIPLTALQAYQSAARQQNLTDPSCRIPWPLLAAIGRVESDHGRFGGAVLHTDGLSTPGIIGIALDGSRSALIRDTDHGRLDGDTVYDRAVGPMQFIPSTWASYRADGNGDGATDPFNIFDATAAAARYLCAAGGNLTTAAGQQRAVLAYNHSAAYLSAVLHLEALYAGGVPGLSVPVLPTTPPPAVPRDVPPVNPGPPPALDTATQRPSAPATSRHRTSTTSPHESSTRDSSPHESSSARTSAPGSTQPRSTAPSTPAPTASCPPPSPTSMPVSTPSTTATTQTGTMGSHDASRGESSCPSTASTTPCSTSATRSAAPGSTATCSASASSRK